MLKTFQAFSALTNPHGMRQLRAGARRAALPVLAAVSLAANLAPVDGPPLHVRLAQGVGGARRLAAGGCGTDFTDVIRALAAKAPPEADLAVVVGDEAHPQSSERLVHLAAAFGRLPRPTEITTSFGAVAFDAILAPLRVGDQPPGDFASFGFAKVAESGSFVLWVREGTPGDGVAPRAHGETPPPPTRRDARSLAGMFALLAVALFGFFQGGAAVGLLSVLTASFVFFVLLALGLPPSRTVAATALFVAAAPPLLLRFKRRRGGRADAPHIPSLPKGLPILPWCLFVCVSLVLTLGHAYAAPNGLGVVGGRAMLWFTSGDFRAAFGAGHAFDTFQPAYPPGLALLALLSHALSGAGNDWQMQLLGLVPFWILFGLFLVRAKSSAMRLLLLALFLSPSCLDMATSFYSEGWEILLVVVGLDFLLQGRSMVAWPFVAAAGWFKAEGLVFATALFMAARLSLGARRAPIPVFAVSCLAPLSWWVFARAHGAGVFEYAAPWAPDLLSLPAIARAIAEGCLARPWETAFAFPILIAGLALPPRAREAAMRWRLALLFTVLSLVAVTWIFALSRADLDWHLWSAMPRLLWCIATVALFVCRDLTKGQKRNACTKHVFLRK